MRTIFTFIFIFISVSIFAQITEHRKAAFIENKGQIIDQNGTSNAKALFVLPLNGINVQLTMNGFGYDTYITTKKKNTSSKSRFQKNLYERLTKTEKNQTESYFNFHRVDVLFEGANPKPEIISSDVCPDYLNFFTKGNDALQVKQYKKVVYKNLYNGIDLEFTTGSKNKDWFEYNFIVHPGADVNKIKIKYEGAISTRLTNRNSIMLKLAHGELEEKIPLSYDAVTGKKVAVQYTMKGQGVYGFKASTFNRNNTLIIDPTPERTWATYYGGAGNEFFNNDFATSMARDANNNLYLCGSTNSTVNIATTGAYQTVVNNIDAYLAKFNSNGVRQWGTYYGGSGTEYGNSVTVDGSGSVVIVGYTESSSAIATTGTHQTSLNGLSDGFIAKFNSNGGRLWGSYYGGSDDDILTHVAASGTELFFTGLTFSNNGIATTGAHQTTYGGASEQDALVGRMNGSGVRQWGTYYGSTGFDGLYCVFVDASQNVYVAGESNSTAAIASAGAHQVNNAGLEDGVLVRFNASGVRQWGTYYGGTESDIFIGVTTDASGNIYVTGATESSNNISTAGAHQTSLSVGGLADGLIVKFAATGARQWGTYFGGISTEGFISIQTASDASVYVAGLTTGSSGLATTGAYQLNYGGGISDAVLLKMNTNGVRQWSTYYGSSGEDVTTSLSVSTGGVFFVAGYTNSTSGIASPGSHQATYAGGSEIDEFDAFLGRFTDVVTSVSLLSLSNGISIYPNPASREFVVKYANTTFLSSIELYDISGKLVKSERILPAIGPIRINVSGLPGGTYLLKIINNKQQLIGTEQIIIQQ